MAERLIKEILQAFKRTSFTGFLRELPVRVSGKDEFAGFLAQVDGIQQAGLTEMLKAGMREENAKALLLKISNYLIGKCQYQNRHEYLISSPYGLIVDPSNGCPLHCPGCLHNNLFRQKMSSDWPSGLLEPKIFQDYIEKYGPYSATILFYNWGEPLLNKHTPDFIRLAKGYLAETSLSSNLSTQFDAEALVLSGVDYMILSVDGATKETYEQYRQGGQFDLVVDNMRRLVAAKKKHNLLTPHLSWQFLMFEHNKHEIETVKRMADEIGVNEVRFAQPYDVIWDPELQPAKDIEAETYSVAAPGCGTDRIVPEISAFIPALFEERWVDRIVDVEPGLFTRRAGSTCKWLYTSLVMDARGRYLPCCYVPRKNSGFQYVFAENGAASGNDPYNSEYYRFGRKHFVWLSELRNEGGIAPVLAAGKSAPYCVACQDTVGKPLINEFHLRRYLQEFDNCKFLDDAVLDLITEW